MTMTQDASSWNAGYLVDQPYVPFYHPSLAPSRIDLAMLAAGVLPVGCEEPFTYCELAMGSGASVALNAAVYPHGRFYGVDFNPEHVRIAQNRIPPEVENIELYEADFETFSNRTDLPKFDYIVLHGTYSWIQPEVRAHVQQFVRKHVSTRGCFVVSYANDPCWTIRSSVRDLSKFVLPQNEMFSQIRLDHMHTFLKQFMSWDPPSLKRFESAKRMIQAQTEGNRWNTNVQAHELLSEELVALSLKQVVEDFKKAKMKFVGSTNLIAPIPVMNMSEKQINFYRTIPDPILRESYKEHCQNAGTRVDIFSRSVLRLTRHEILERFKKVEIELAHPRQSIPKELALPIGKVTLNAELYDPIFDALNERAMTGAELCQIQTANGPPSPLQMRDAILIMTHYRLGSPLVTASHKQASGETAAAFNFQALQNHKLVDGQVYLAAPSYGIGMGVGSLGPCFLNALFHEMDPIESAIQQLAREDQKIVIKGETLTELDQMRTHITTQYDQFVDTTVPLLAKAGVLETQTEEPANTPPSSSSQQRASQKRGKNTKKKKG